MRGKLVGVVVVAGLALAGCGTDWSGPHIVGDTIDHSSKPKKCYNIEHENSRGYSDRSYGKYCKVGP